MFSALAQEDMEKNSFTRSCLLISLECRLKADLEKQLEKTASEKGEAEDRVSELKKSVASLEKDVSKASKDLGKANA